MRSADSVPAPRTSVSWTGTGLPSYDATQAGVEIPAAAELDRHGHPGDGPGEARMTQIVGEDDLDDLQHPCEL